MQTWKPKFGLIGFIILLFFTLNAFNQVEANPISLVFEDAAYRDIFQTLGEIGGYNVFIDDSVVGKGDLKIAQITISEALELVSELSGYTYRINQDNLFIGGQQQLTQYEKSEVRYIYTRYVAPESIVAAISMVLPSEQIYVQTGSNLLVLSGVSTDLDRAEQLILELDQPAKINMQEERSVLSILQQITQDLHLNLVADPKLMEKQIILDAWQLDPWEVLELLEELTTLEVVVQGDTLVAGEKDKTVKERIKVYRLNHMEPEVVARTMGLVLPEDKIQVDTDSKSVMIKASDAAIKEIDEFIIEYDQPPPQVFLEVWIQEMGHDAMQSLGLEWSAKPKEGQNTTNLSVFELNLEPWEISFVLKALEDQGKVRVLASPKLATLSGKEATMFVGERVPVVLVDDEGREQLQFLESGVNLKVLPRVADDGFITINVRPEASTFAFVAGSDYPQIRTREAETTIRVKDGQPVLIGGLLQEQETEIVNKVPILGELPLIGGLFTNKTTKTEQTEMNIFLIPRIVDGSEGLISSSLLAADPEFRQQTTVEPLKPEKKQGIDYWIAGYHARDWQLELGLTKRFDPLGFGLGIQRVNDEFSFVTNLALYTGTDANMRLELNIPFSFEFDKTGIGVGLGLPIKYQGLTIEPNVGFYFLDKDVAGRFGIRVIK